jgi:amino acid transporter
MVMLFPVLYIGWKLIHRTRIYKAKEVDLHKDLDVVEEYERNFIPVPPKCVFLPCTLQTVVTNFSQEPV